MAEVKTEQEPSIEEILESIRQIISEDADDKNAAEAPKSVPSAAPAVPPARQPAPPSPAKAAAPAKSPAPPLDLTEKIDSPPVAPKPKTPMTIEMMDKPMTDDSNSLISEQTAEVVTESLSKLLAGNVAVERDDMGHPGKVTLEEIAREMMRPMIKTWLDQNLPGIIEKLVQKEVEKLSRRAMDR